MQSNLIEIETDINVGLHSFNIVGWQTNLFRSQGGVSSALKIASKTAVQREQKNCCKSGAADVKKTGSQYDLAIAIGYLLATKQIKDFDAKNKIFAGELALDGGLRGVSGF